MLFILLKELNLVREHEVQWQLGEWNLALRKDVHDVELEGHTGLLVDWEDLDPSDSLSVVDHAAKFLPVQVR